MRKFGTHLGLAENDFALLQETETLIYLLLNRLLYLFRVLIGFLQILTLLPFYIDGSTL